MGALETILLILLVLNAIALGALVLLQQGKGADIGAAFGSGAASTVFGGSGSASFLAKLTAWLAIGFFVLSLGLAFSAKERATSLKDLGVPGVPAETPTQDGVPNRTTDVPRNDSPTGAQRAPVNTDTDVPTDVPPQQPGDTTQAVPPNDANAPQTLTPPNEPVDSDVPHV
jgi:preprotein translocase subunit SecG